MNGPGVALALVWAAPAFAADPTARFGVPPAWLDAMSRAEVTHPDRTLVHASHTCDLRVDGSSLHVVDVREIVLPMAAPRGVNHIVVLDAGGAVLRSFGYVDERPMRCDVPLPRFTARRGPAAPPARRTRSRRRSRC